ASPANADAQCFTRAKRPVECHITIRIGANLRRRSRRWKCLEKQLRIDVGVRMHGFASVSIPPVKGRFISHIVKFAQRPFGSTTDGVAAQYVHASLLRNLPHQFSRFTLSS